ncbi:hypothetical protein [Streptomyces sp. NPDC004134]|uniref:hypothetical protein n=1 Tax=Streptomyces sp. NPDC004134 TaxID=3364691 RepID=UPI0036CA07C5
MAEEAGTNGIKAQRIADWAEEYARDTDDRVHLSSVLAQNAIAYALLELAEAVRESGGTQDD